MAATISLTFAGPPGNTTLALGQDLVLCPTSMRQLPPHFSPTYYRAACQGQCHAHGQGHVNAGAGLCEAEASPRPVGVSARGA